MARNTKKKTMGVNIIKMNIFVKAALLTFICICAATIINMQFEHNRLRESEDVLKTQIAVMNNRIEELSAQLDRPFDDEYVKIIAREKLSYRMPEEIIFYNDLVK